MSYEIIDIPEQYQFITEVPEFKQDLPDNVYLDKVSTGCGATFAVLTNDVNYVVVVPFISLGENKVDQSEANPGRGRGQYPHKLFMLSGGDKLKLGYKGSYRDIAKTYISTLLKLGQKEALADWFVEELEQTKIAIETDPRFETIVEYVSIFGADPSLVEGCSARLGMSYLSKRIDKHKHKLRLQEVLRYKYNEGDILTNKVLKEDLAHLYQVLDLKGKPSLRDQCYKV